MADPAGGDAPGCASSLIRIYSVLDIGLMTQAINGGMTCRRDQRLRLPENSRLRFNFWVVGLYLLKGLCGPIRHAHGYDPFHLEEFPKTAPDDGLIVVQVTCHPYGHDGSQKDPGSS
jgi:hypothetical protein